MTEQEARRLLMLVNQPEFDQLFKSLVDIRKRAILETVSSIADDVELRHMQGRLKELDYIKDIKQRIHDLLGRNGNG